MPNVSNLTIPDNNLSAVIPVQGEVFDPAAMLVQTAVAAGTPIAAQILERAVEQAIVEAAPVVAKMAVQASSQMKAAAYCLINTPSNYAGYFLQRITEVCKNVKNCCSPITAVWSWEILRAANGQDAMAHYVNVSNPDFSNSLRGMDLCPEPGNSIYNGPCKAEMLVDKNGMGIRPGSEKDPEKYWAQYVGQKQSFSCKNGEVVNKGPEECISRAKSSAKSF